MLIDLDLRPGSPPTAPPSLDAFTLCAHAATQPGIVRRLSDLVVGVTRGSVLLADAPAARSAVAAGHDPVLYRAYRDVLAPRSKPSVSAGIPPGTASWFADLIAYHPGGLQPIRDARRSLGHWNTPSQIEIFQCLTGRVVMLTVPPPPRQCTVDYQVCDPGDHAVIPFGAWHLTVVLGGPALVFNTYTDLNDTGLDGAGHTARDASTDPALKYHTQPPPPFSIVTTSTGLALQVADTGPGVRRARRVAPPTWTRRLQQRGGLAAVYQRESDELEELATLISRRHVPLTGTLPQRSSPSDRPIPQSAP